MHLRRVLRVLQGLKGTEWLHQRQRLQLRPHRVREVSSSCVFCLDHCFTLQMMDAEGNGWEGVLSLTNNQGQTSTPAPSKTATTPSTWDTPTEVGAAADGNLVECILETSEHDPVAGGAGESLPRIQRIQDAPRLGHATTMRRPVWTTDVCAWGKRSD